MSQFRETYLPHWESFIRELIPSPLPENVEWNSIVSIVDVLNALAAPPNVNHLFFPRGGGMDLTGASIAQEAGCVELHFGSGCRSILRPEKLTCEIIESNMEFSYFRLSCSRLKPSQFYNDNGNSEEQLLLLPDGEYTHRSTWDRGYMGLDEDGYEIPLPDEARPVSRHFSGSLVIFCKASFYNLTRSTYDARHNKMSEQRFRAYIEKNSRLETSV